MGRRWQRPAPPLPPEAQARVDRALSDARARRAELTPEEAAAALAALYDNPLSLEYDHARDRARPTDG